MKIKLMYINDQVHTKFLLLTFKKKMQCYLIGHRQDNPHHLVPFLNTIYYCMCHFNFDLCDGGCDLSPGPTQNASLSSFQELQFISFRIRIII